MSRTKRLEGTTNSRHPYPVLRTEASLADLSLFRARAVIDWIELEIHTARSTNFPTVQDRVRASLGGCRRAWIEALDEGPGRAATRFLVRVQEPPDSLLIALDEFAARMPLAEVPAIRRIEVSVDFYSRRYDRSELEAMVLRLKRTLNATGPKEIECGPAGTERVLDVRDLRADRTLVIGRPGIQWRVYLKVTDLKQPIPNPAQHRARVEVTLDGEGLPSGLADVDCLKAFRFESLCGLFAFRELRPMELIGSVRTPAEVALKRRQELVLGKGPRELPIPKRRKHSPLTRADGEMKQRVRDALRDLTRRMHARKPGRNKSGPIESAQERRLTLMT